MDRLDSMIHDLLDAGKIRTGENLSLNFEECDLDLVTRQNRQRDWHDYRDEGGGLTVVQSFTNAHHGTVQVDSHEGRGTTFTIVLPKDSRSQTQAPRAPASKLAATIAK